MKTFLIACSASQKDLNLHEQLANNKSIKDLSFGNFYTLNNKKEKVPMSKYRQYILDKYNGEDIINLKSRDRIIINWNDTMPAYQRYNGRVYNQIANENFINCDCNNWVDCNCGNKWFEILILSPLWGWIKHTDYIPNYNLDMNDKINIGNKQYIELWKLWSVCFNNILQVNENRKYYDINNCCDLLFSSSMYRPAVQFDKKNKNYDTQEKAKKALCDCNGDKDAKDRGDAIGKLLNKRLNETIKEKTRGEDVESFSLFRHQKIKLNQNFDDLLEDLN